jgi:SAM-dependent methyltransferase
MFDDKSAKILDIASNDGTFLDKFNKYGWDLYGVDPAENLEPLAKKKGINTYVSFFGSDDIEFDCKFDFITALNVFAHVPNPKQFLLECKKNLAVGGKIVIQTSQRDMVEERQFDTVYHEHLSFFSVRSMQAVCSRVGLFVNDIILPEIHGKSYVFVISMEDYQTDRLQKRIQQEIESGRYGIELYDTFQSSIFALESSFYDNLTSNPLVAFGAAAKGVVALHSLNITPEYVVDENKLKIGKSIPKLDIPIVGLERLANWDEDLDILILAWNFYDEISKKIKTIRGDRDNLICLFGKEKVNKTNT